MKNSYFILPTTNYNSTYTLSDIFSTNKRGILPDAFISDNEDAFYYIIVSDNTTLESISYNEYGRSDYWDLLFKLNQMSSPFDLPKSIDYVIKMVDEELVIWNEKFPNLSDSLIEEKRNELVNKYTDINEIYRKFRCIKTSYIQEMFKALKNE